MLSKWVTHLIFVTKAHNFLYHWLVIIISVTSFYENFQGDKGERGPKGNDGMNGLKVGVEISY